MVIKTINKIIENLKKEPKIQAIALSGHSIPQKPGQGDIDLFIYCKKVPEPQLRQNLYPSSIRNCPKYTSRIFKGDIWGDADYSEINEIETWIMYFKIDDVINNFNRIIKGENVGRDNGFYPSGRLAMFKNMNVLLDKNGFIAGLKKKLETYPEKMGNSIKQQCFNKMHDEEDMIRACGLKDVMFFHISIDEAIDALLQYLFTINKEIFPSRKRNNLIIDKFHKKPDNCVKRIIEILQWGTHEDSLERSFTEYKKIRDEVIALE